MPGVQGQPGDGDRSNRRATQSANTNGRHRPPGCLDVARGTHLGQRPGAASQAGHMTAFEPPPTSRPIRLNPAGSSKTITKARRSMMDHHANAGLGRPAFPSVARWLAALKDASRRARARWPRGGARPSLTAANQPASEVSGRGRKTALQPNRKTRLQQGSGRKIRVPQDGDIPTSAHAIVTCSCHLLEPWGPSTHGITPASLTFLLAWRKPPVDEPRPEAADD